MSEAMSSGTTSNGAEDSVHSDTTLSNTTMSEPATPGAALATNPLIFFDSDTITKTNSEKPDPDLLIIAMGVLQHANADLRATFTAMQLCAQALVVAESDKVSSKDRQIALEKFNSDWEAHIQSLNDPSQLPPIAKELHEAACKAFRRQWTRFSDGIFLVIADEEIISGSITTKILRKLKEAISIFFPTPPSNLNHPPPSSSSDQSWWTTWAVPRLIFALNFTFLSILYVGNFFILNFWLLTIYGNWPQLKQGFPKIPPDVGRWTIWFAIWIFVAGRHMWSVREEMEKMEKYGLRYDDPEVVKVVQMDKREKAVEKREKELQKRERDARNRKTGDCGNCGNCAANLKQLAVVAGEAEKMNRRFEDLKSFVHAAKVEDEAWWKENADLLQGELGMGGDGLFDS